LADDQAGPVGRATRGPLATFDPSREDDAPQQRRSPVPRRRRAEPEDDSSNHAPPPAVAEAMLDAIGLVAPPTAAAGYQYLPPPRVNVHGLRLTLPWKIEDPELRRVCARAVFEARCGRLWFARRPVTLKGTRSCWLESVMLGEDGAPLDRSDAFRLPWREARQRVHAAVLTDMVGQVPVRCLWRGLPDLPKMLKHTKAGAILEEIERQPAR
jgi:hypothetical protein